MIDCDDGDDSFVSAEECAERLGLTTAEVAELVKRKVLRANTYDEVQPAVIAGLRQWLARSA